MHKKTSLLILLLALEIHVQAQGLFSVPDSVIGWRRVTNVVTQSAITTSTLGGLQLAWYQDYQTGGFHFFNDWPGWMQMDKAGHINATYQISKNVHDFNRWTGMNNTRSALWAAAAGWAYQCTFEVMDGFSEGWGFSPYDVVFNTVGAGIFLSQQLTWKEQRIKIKYSFWPSGLDRMNDFGSNFNEVNRAEYLYGAKWYEQWLKDYNGQTIWVSTNLYATLGKPIGFPKWLNVAVGMSTNNVLGAESNEWTIDAGTSTERLYSSDLIRERQFLLSMDIDVDQLDLPPKWVWLKGVIGFVKIPFPALEWNVQRGIIAHGLYL